MGASTGGPGGNFAGGDNSALIAYLQANRNGAKYLVATYGAQAAAPLINATGENVLPIGGFDGSDPAPTLAQFKALVAAGDLRFVLGSDKGGRQPMNGATTASGDSIQAWVSANCSIDANAPSGQNLYICAAN